MRRPPREIVIEQYKMIKTLPVKSSISITFTNSGLEIVIEPYALGMFHFPDAEPRFFQRSNDNQTENFYVR